MPLSCLDTCSILAREDTRHVPEGTADSTEGQRPLPYGCVQGLGHPA